MRTSVLISAMCLPLLASDTLDERVRAVTVRIPAKVFVYAKNLDTGATYGLSENERVRTASTIKLPIMAAVFDLAEKGRVDWGEQLTLLERDKISGSGVLTEFDSGSKLSLRTLVHLMIVVSDNTATNLILDRISADAVNDLVDRLKLPQTRSLRKVMGAEASGWSRAGKLEENKRFGLGVSTPREMVLLLEKIARGEVVSRAASEEMIAILKRQQDNGGIRRRIDYEVANKAGALDHLRSDVGIVFTPRGRIAMAITCEDIPTVDYRPDNPGLLAIADIAKVLAESL